MSVSHGVENYFPRLWGMGILFFQNCFLVMFGGHLQFLLKMKKKGTFAFETVPDGVIYTTFLLTGYKTSHLSLFSKGYFPTIFGSILN